MSNITFPTASSIGQTFTVGSKTWRWNGYAWDLYQVLSGGISISNTSASISNATGALTVAGGAGIAGNVYANAVYTTGLFYSSNGNPWITGGGGATGGASASGYLANSFIFANSTGYLSNTSNLQYFASNNTTVFSGNVSLSSPNTASISNTTGTLTVVGGVGVTGNLYTGPIYIIPTATGNGITFADGTTQYTSAQSAYTLANTANNSAQSAYTLANTANNSAQTAYTLANTANNSAQTAYTLANAANTTAQNAYNKANTLNSFSSIVVSGQSTLYANSATAPLTFVGAGGLTITTNQSTNTITFTQTTSGGGSTSNTNSFSTIIVSGQPTLYANSPTASLTLVGAGGTTITTNSTTNTITITSSTSGGGSGSTTNSFSSIIVSGQPTLYANSNTAPLTLVGAGGLTITTNQSTNTITFTQNTSGGGTTTSGFLPNSIIYANSTGYLSNSSSLQYFVSNNTTLYSGSIYLNGSTSNVIITQSTLSQDVTATYNHLYTLGLFSSNTDQSVQIGGQNFANTANASTDLALYNNAGTDTSNYVDLGIISKNYNTVINNFTVAQPGDAYLYSNGSNLLLGTYTAGTNLKVFVGGYTSSNTAAVFNSPNTASYSNTTGTLTVTGGLGVTGNVYSNNIYINGIYYASNGNPWITGGGGGGSTTTTNSFSTIIVSGQPTLYANSATAPLTLVGAGGTTITTNSTTNTITITSSTGGGGGGAVNGYQANSVIFANTGGYLSNTSNIQFFTSNNTLVVTGNISVTGTIGGISPRISNTASSSTPTPNSSNTDQFILSAASVAATFQIPTGTPNDGQRLMIRIKDNGTAVAIGWVTTGTNSYRPVGVFLPTTTVASKVLYVGCIYNSQDQYWDVVSVAQQ